MYFQTCFLFSSCAYLRVAKWDKTCTSYWEFNPSGSLSDFFLVLITASLATMDWNSVFWVAKQMLEKLLKISRCYLTIMVSKEMLVEKAEKAKVELVKIPAQIQIC